MYGRSAGTEKARYPPCWSGAKMRPLAPMRASRRADSVGKWNGVGAPMGASPASAAPARPISALRTAARAAFAVQVGTRPPRRGRPRHDDHRAIAGGASMIAPIGASAQ